MRLPGRLRVEAAREARPKVRVEAAREAGAKARGKAIHNPHPYTLQIPPQGARAIE